MQDASITSEQLLDTTFQVLEHMAEIQIKPTFLDIYTYFVKGFISQGADIETQEIPGYI